MFPEIGNCDQREIQVVISEDGALVRLCGDIDIDSCPALLERFRTLFEAPHATVVSVDLSGVSRLDSSGVATLVEALRIAGSYNTEMRLQGLEGRVLRLFQSTGIFSLFNGSTRTTIQCGEKAI